MHKNSQFGFTLMELLVVIAIIALLLAILSPALNKAKQQARSVVCMANMRSMGQAIMTYCAGNGGQMVMMMQRHRNDPLINGAAGNGKGYFWSGLLYEYCKIDLSDFRCPSDIRKYDLSKDNFLVGGGWFDYTALFVGYGLSGRRVPWSFPSESQNIARSQLGSFLMSKVKRPYNRIMLWDGYYSVLSQWSGWEAEGGMFDIIETTMTKANTPLVQQEDYEQLKGTIFRHSGNYSMSNGERYLEKGPNCIFYDGHAEPRIDLYELEENNFSVK